MSQWIRVEDSLPDPKQYVMTIGGMLLRVPFPARVTRSKDGIEFWWAFRQIKPTHWMPIEGLPPKAA